MFRKYAISAVLTLLALPRASWACGGPGFPEILILSVFFAAIAALVGSAIIFWIFLLITGRDSVEKPHFKRVFLCIFLISTPMLSLMLPSSGGGATAAAEASNIIAELRNLKAATAMHFANHPESADVPPSPLQNHVEALKPYLDNPEKIVPELYTLRAGPQAWWVGFRTDTLYEESRKKLAGRAENRGLYGSPQFDTLPKSPDKRHLYRKNDGAVWMLVPVPEERT